MLIYIYIYMCVFCLSVFICPFLFVFMMFLVCHFWRLFSISLSLSLYLFLPLPLSLFLICFLSLSLSLSLWAPQVPPKTPRTAKNIPQNGKHQTSHPANEHARIQPAPLFGNMCYTTPVTEFLVRAKMPDVAYFGSFLPHMVRDDMLLSLGHILTQNLESWDMLNMFELQGAK